MFRNLKIWPERSFANSETLISVADVTMGMVLLPVARNVSNSFQNHPAYSVWSSNDCRSITEPRGLFYDSALIPVEQC